MSETFTPPTPPKEWMKYIGTLGGKSKSPKKREALKKNMEKARAALKAKQEHANSIDNKQVIE